MFKKCKLSLTISSTAGLESLLVNIPTVFITDFCKNSNKYGSNDFKKFNATITFKELFNKKYPKINYQLVHNTLKFDGQNTYRLTKELISLSRNETLISESSSKKEILIVGSSPNLLDIKNGKIIDGFELVCRFNDYKINGYEEYVGSKTTQ